MIRTTGDIIALSPPLIIEKADIDRIVETLARILQADRLKSERNQESRRWKRSRISSAARSSRGRSDAHGADLQPRHRRADRRAAALDGGRTRRGGGHRQGGADGLGRHAAAEARPRAVQVQGTCSSAMPTPSRAPSRPSMARRMTTRSARCSAASKWSSSPAAFRIS